VKGSIQSSAECIHLGCFIHIGSSGISAPFLVPFAEFLVPLWGVMYILDRSFCHGQVTISFSCLGSGVFRQGYFPNRKST